MACAVDNLVFGSESKKAIKEIRDMTKRANWLSTALAISALGDIFVKNGPVSASYKIYTTDFELLGNAMSSSTQILKRKISDLAGTMVILKASSLTASEKKFWSCVYNEVR